MYAYLARGTSCQVVGRPYRRLCIYVYIEIEIGIERYRDL